MMRRLALLGLLALAAFAAWATYGYFDSVGPQSLAAASYVGRQSCAECHQTQMAAYHGSDHDRAMELATDESVLGDFRGAAFTRFGAVTRFTRDGDKFMVNAEGPDGEHHDYQIKYTFGVDPLQQYLVEFPGGRLQVLRESWDVRKKQWFFVAPPDAADEAIGPDDPLHWTGLAQNWNTMCAECHSTDYRKNFDLAKNEYHPVYSEIDVSCEACHGPASVHVQLAQRRSLFWDRQVGYGLVASLKHGTADRQIDACAPCHSRRTMIHADYRPGDAFLNHFEPTLLHLGLYHADGQIQDEVFEYASFQQSKMYAKGVRCTDCHDPHRGDVKYPGNQLCSQCHQPGKYDGPAHHRHEQAAAGSAETQCVSCHMPTRTYMGIDARHDHAIRVPRPDLSVELGTPNACNACHVKPAEDAAWAADAVRRWYGEKRPDDPHYARALAAARKGDPTGGALLSQLIERQESPAIVRATAVELLGAYPSATSETALRAAFGDRSPLVRASAARSSAPVQFLDQADENAQEQARQNVERLGRALEDPVRSVRLAAVSRFFDAVDHVSRTRFAQPLQRALQEYRNWQDIYLERADSHLNLSQLALSRQPPDAKAAVTELREAIRLEPYRTDPRGQLAAILQRIGDDVTQTSLASELGATPEEVERLRREEVELLRRDATLLPDDSRPHYRCGMMLYLLKDMDAAREELAEACRVAPNDYDSLLASALINKDQRRWKDATTALKKMSELRPDAQDWPAIYREIVATIKKEQDK